MTRELDLTGHRYGRLVVIKKINSELRKNVRWLCRCDCGNERLIAADSLRRKDHPTNSCGCIRLEKQRKEFGECSFNRLYGIYTRDAKHRNHKFCLTKDEFKIITSGNCFYCGTPPQQVMKGETSYGAYLYNGVDRIDNSKEYVFENCISCCGKCNHMKFRNTIDDFRNQIILIYNHWANQL